MSIITTESGIEKVDLDEGWDKIRFRLLRASYVLNRVVEALRSKYGIEIKNGKSNWSKIAFTKHWDDLVPYLKKWGYFALDKQEDHENRSLITHFSLREAEKVILPEIALLSEKLSMDEGYLRVFVLYNNRTNKVDGPASLEPMKIGDKVRQNGIYVRLNDIQSASELTEIYEKYRVFYADSIFKNEDQKIPKYMKPRRKMVSKEDRWKIKAYLRIQEDLIYLSRPKIADEYSGTGKKLGLAIERVAGDLLSDSDEVEDKSHIGLQKMIKSAYEDVRERYRIPPLKEIPVLLRLIGC